ncbi:unnamed protein product, partial [Notodromas monacha]
IVNLIAPKPSRGGNENLQAFGLIVFLSTASYYCIQVAKAYLWPFSLVAEVTLLVALVSLYFLYAAKRPVVYCDHPKLKTFLHKNVPVLNERFWVTPWAWGGCVQTVLASFLGEFWPFAPKKIQYERELLTLKDGGEVALDWKHDGCLHCKAEDDSCHPEHKQQPVVLILPGITGNSDAFYVNSIIQGMSGLGVCFVVFNNRGLGGLRLKTPRTYCGCNTEDLEEVVQYLKKKLAPGTPLASVGISLGSLIMCHYLSKKGKESGLVGSVAVCPPWDTFRGTESLESAWPNTAINHHLAKCLTEIYDRLIMCHYLSKKGKESGLVGSVAICPPWDTFRGTESLESAWPNTAINHHLAKCLTEIYDRERDMLETRIGDELAAKATTALVMSSRTIREFDDRFTAPQFGYPSVDAYYADARMTDKLRSVRTPLLALSAADDPFQPEDGIPRSFGEASTVAIAVTRRGGHIGFLQGVFPFSPVSNYYSRFTRDFLCAVFGHPGFSDKEDNSMMMTGNE